jgi:hypothetical protein
MHARFRKDFERAVCQLTYLLLVDDVKMTGGANRLEQGCF